MQIGSGTHDQSFFKGLFLNREIDRFSNVPGRQHAHSLSGITSRGAYRKFDFISYSRI